MMKLVYVIIHCTLMFFILTSSPVLARNAVVPGEFIIEPPTLICFGFEWKVEGDDNHNATVVVSYRKKGSDAWKEALPLLRIGKERIFYRGVIELEYETPNMFAGSIFDLMTDTEYECRFVMSDPDGVKGEKTKTVTVKTRGEPKAFESGRVFHVYPPGHEDSKQEPAFSGLKEAFFGVGGGDWGVAADPRVEPGDIILVHAGLYKANRFKYGDPYGIDFHGTYVLTRSGTPEKPIVIRAAGDGEVIFDGDGCYRLFDVMAADNIFFEGLTIRNTGIAFYAGLKDVLGCSGLVVRNCRIEDVSIGVMTQYAGSKNFYIADNVMIGRDNPEQLHGWTGFWIKNADPKPLKSFFGVKVYGQGHVVCYNYIAHFHDAICVCTHGVPEEEQSLKAVSIDFYNNDIFMMSDDFIEADGGVHNIRVFRNRGFNAAHHGLSAQPIYGGPAYYIRNIVYNVPPGGALKFNVNPSGMILYNNTFCTEWTTSGGFSNAHLRNNLFLGADYPGRPILRVSTFTSYTTFDYNGYRPNQGTEKQFVWRSPADGKFRDYDIYRSVENKSFETLKEFSRGTAQEIHGKLVDYDIFKDVRKPDHEHPAKVYRTEDFDFRLKSNSAAIDAGCVLPNVNDTFTGKAPDIGALEMGEPLPHYGPRNSGRK